jgi:hypothetical protein
MYRNCDLFEVVMKNISHMKLPDEFRRWNCWALLNVNDSSNKHKMDLIIFAMNSQWYHTCDWLLTSSIFRSNNMYCIVALHHTRMMKRHWQLSEYRLCLVTDVKVTKWMWLWNTEVWVRSEHVRVNRCWRWNLNIGNRETQCVQCAVCIVRTVYSTCKWDRIVRTVVQYVLWGHSIN